MTEWRPIDTAPKDGAPVLVWGSHAGEVDGPAGEPGAAVASWTSRTDYAGYNWLMLNTAVYAVWVKATHWVPLPEAPA